MYIKISAFGYLCRIVYAGREADVEFGREKKQTIRTNPWQFFVAKGAPISINNKLAKTTSFKKLSMRFRASAVRDLLIFFALKKSFVVIAQVISLA